MKLSRSTYYYEIGKTDKIQERNADITSKIESIFQEHKGRYGVRRVCQELAWRGFPVNHKRVQRIMHRLGLAGKRPKEKYHSYRGEVGKVADNIINRDFSTDRPLQKWTTDVTQFTLSWGKCYLSPILDMNTNEVISYDLSLSPNMEQIKDMLHKAFERFSDVEGLIMHSDQGWQYQHATYRSELQKHKIIQSMSRKGNCYDNCIMETFFGRLKNEMFYGYEKEYSSFKVFSKAIADYIDYYNNRRIQAKTKWMPPVKFREASLMKNELFSSTGAVQIIGYISFFWHWRRFCGSFAQFRLGKMQVLHFCPVVRNQPGRAGIVIHDQGEIVGNGFRGQVPQVKQDGLMEFLPFDVFQLHTAEVIPNGEEGSFPIRTDPDPALFSSNAQQYDKLSEIQNVVIGHGNALLSY